VEASKHFGEDGDVLSTLWLNGLLGYVDRANHNGSVTFYADEGAVRFKLPRNYSHYAFHPCLIEAAGLQPTGKPVVPCR
jgi:hypothetical protein